MLTPDQTRALQILYTRLSEPITEYLLTDISRRIKEAGQLTSTAAYQTYQAELLGVSLPEIEKRVAELTGQSVEQAREIISKAAEFGYMDDISRLAGGVAFSDNSTVQQLLTGYLELVDGELRNITQTLGFVGVDGQVHILRDAYISTTDFAFNQVITGATDYNTAIRQACTKLATFGVLYVDYASNISTSMEAAIRRNLLSGTGLLVEKISQHNHDELGADGWEISAHAACAPDHEDIQGKQYTDREYEALNNSLKRRIGTLNCGHNASPIILGISQPQYTNDELERFKRDNKVGVSYEGREFATVYEATQYQRAIERSIRAWERRVMVGTNPNAKARLKALRAEYRRFCKATGLRTEDERLFVGGFKLK